MGKREYYSTRTGKNPVGKTLDLMMLKRLFLTVHEDFERRGYFQETFGYHCVDDGDVPGAAGPDVEAYVLRNCRKSNLWPVDARCDEYTEDDLFDIMEFLYDHTSKPKGGRYHDYGDCGWHFDKFEKSEGQDEFRAEVNELLCDYDRGYELSANGEILELAEPGMEALLEAKLPQHDPTNVEGRVEKAVTKFRRYRSSVDERREAVRELAEVLEYLRPKLKKVISNKDESDLFNIANNFAIRHHNQTQKREYDQSIWLSWMFYFNLAFIHASVRLIQKAEGT